MADRNFEYINKILEFYENRLSAGFENDIFKEGGSEGMVLRRLERAVKDEAVETCSVPDTLFGRTT